ncbi:MAG: Ku protein [Fimbriimonas sp.]
MARPVWNGVITFGMVSIPVGLSTAVTEKDLSFNQLHTVCGSRIKQQKYCPVCDTVVESKDIQRGYEYSKGHYVVLEEKDLEELPVPSKQTITVTAFVQASSIDATYYDTSYYIDPSELGKKPFALLMKALETRGVCAIGKVALRSKESLCVIRLADGIPIMETLYYPDEVKKPSDLKLDSVNVDERELKMALSLVDLMTGEFAPGEHNDVYREKLLERIESKIAGQEFTVAPVAQPTQVLDLMEALKASLAAAMDKKATG